MVGAYTTLLRKLNIFIDDLLSQMQTDLRCIVDEEQSIKE